MTTSHDETQESLSHKLARFMDLNGFEHTEENVKKVIEDFNKMAAPLLDTRLQAFAHEALREGLEGLVVASRSGDTEAAKALVSAGLSALRLLDKKSVDHRQLERQLGPLGMSLVQHVVDYGPFEFRKSD